MSGAWQVVAQMRNASNLWRAGSKVYILSVRDDAVEVAVKSRRTHAWSPITVPPSKVNNARVRWIPEAMRDVAKAHDQRLRAREKLDKLKQVQRSEP